MDDNGRVGKNRPPLLSDEQRRSGRRASALHRTVDGLLRDGTVSGGEHNVLIVAIRAGMFDEIDRAIATLEDRLPGTIRADLATRLPDALMRIREKLGSESLLPLAQRRKPGPRLSVGAKAESVRRREQRPWKTDPAGIQRDRTARAYAERHHVDYRAALIAVSPQIVAHEQLTDLVDPRADSGPVAS